LVDPGAIVVQLAWKECSALSSNSKSRVYPERNEVEMKGPH
jgi:hypothetical protein